MTTPEVANLHEAIAVHLGQSVEATVAAGALHFALRQFHEPVDLDRVPLLEQIVGHHAQERRAHREGDSKVDVVTDESFESEQQGRIGFGDRLEEPLLFHVGGGLGVAHERQVRVQHESEVAVSHQPPSFSDASSPGASTSGGALAGSSCRESG